MWLYFFKLAWISLRQTPVMSALMVTAVGIGIAACLVTSTIYLALSENPLSHKDEVLFAVQLDAWDPLNASNGPNDMPKQLTYQDAVALFESDIPTHAIFMYKSGFAVRPENDSIRPFRSTARMTTSDFFQLFDVPFLFGNAWSEGVDKISERVVVLSKQLNERLFNGENSVGKQIELDGRVFKILGVTDDWHPRPKVHDLNNGAYNRRDDMYATISIGIELEMSSWGNTNAWKRETIVTFTDRLKSENTWFQMWVQLDTKKQIDDFSSFIENYIRQQKKLGRFERPLHYHLNTPSEWLSKNNVVRQDNRVLLWLSIIFLLVCLINTIALLLAKFLKKAPSIGVRRALGASKKAIFSQHLYETLMVGIGGGAFGLILSWLGLMGVRYLQPGMKDVAIMHWPTFIMALCFSLLASLFCGLLPAWKISHTQPARYLKVQ